MPNFPKRSDSKFEASFLPGSEKEALARSLLAEFGATQVRPSGDELIHSCVLPFGLHKGNDRNPSASLNWRKLTYICHAGCGSGGLLWFIATCRGTSGKEAKGWLAKESGIGGVQELDALLAYLDAAFDSQPYAKHHIPTLDRRVLEPWKVIHPYLTEVRGIPEQNIVDFQVGYGEFDVRGVRSHRIVIPHFWQGDLVGWQTRRLTNDGTPKYLNTPEFPKDQTLYGDWKPKAEAVVVESPMSVVSKCHLFDNMVATFGATVTDRQVQLLASSPRVTLWFDNDQAGWSATYSVAKRLSNYTQVWVVESDWEEDAADLDDSDARFLVGAAMPYSLWSQPSKLTRRKEVTNV